MGIGACANISPRLYRDVRAYAIPGGSEEIMLDLSIRQALRVHKILGMKL
jgi:alkylation response protein AidB-like acyl-CoA dehydrogenase